MGVSEKALLVLTLWPILYLKSKWGQHEKETDA